ncbi:MAG: 50S ribosomal protein L6 [Deltaproteobacteria bacterium]|nr:50S ribosomal protein L6 [Deltaproteobacteria bacterium]
MSRIGKQPVLIPDGVSVTLLQGKVQAKGPKGTLDFNIPQGCEVKQEEKKLVVVNSASDKAKYGLTRALLFNVIQGVKEGFTKELELVGVGYRGKVEGRKLVLTLGYSNPLDYLLPEGIEVKVVVNKIIISGIDKQKVGQVASEIRGLRLPEPYKGKGVKYVDEVIRRKAGKAMGAGAGAGAK